MDKLPRLRSIDEYEAEKAAQFQRAQSTRTGIACPKCGVEMHNQVGPGGLCVMLTSHPPQKRIECRFCGFETNVYA